MLFPWQFPALPISILGLFLAGLGIFYTVLSIGNIYFDGWGFSFFVNKPKRLVKSGIYSQCRHPFYFGYSFYLLGLILINANLLDILVYLVFLLIILIKTYFEEKYLKEKFGKEYEDYSSITPIFIPYRKYIKGRSPSVSFLVLYILGKSLMPLLFKFRISGREEIPNENFVVVSNHGNFIDPAFVMYGIDKYVRFSVSENYFKRFLFLMNVGGGIPIKKHEKDPSALKNMVRLSRKGNIMGFYPEATRTWDSRPLEPKTGTDKLIKILRLPIVSVRVKGNHLSMPKWSKKFKGSKMQIDIKRFDNPQDAIKFCLSIEAATPEETYKDYRGIEKYIWMCPNCSSYKIKGTKDTVKCENCDFLLEKPKIEELWKYHDSLKDLVNLPIEDTANLIDIYKNKTGEKAKLKLTRDKLFINEKPVEIKTVIMDGNKDIHIYIDGKLQGFVFENTQALMWKEMIKKVYNL